MFYRCLLVKHPMPVSLYAEFNSAISRVFRFQTVNIPTRVVKNASIRDSPVQFFLPVLVNESRECESPSFCWLYQNHYSDEYFRKDTHYCWQYCLLFRNHAIAISVWDFFRLPHPSMDTSHSVPGIWSNGASVASVLRSEERRRGARFDAGTGPLAETAPIREETWDWTIQRGEVWMLKLWGVKYAKKIQEVSMLYHSHKTIVYQWLNMWGVKCS